MPKKLHARIMSFLKGTFPEVPHHLMHHCPPQAINEAGYLAAQSKTRRE